MTQCNLQVSPVLIDKVCFEVLWFCMFLVKTLTWGAYKYWHGYTRAQLLLNNWTVYLIACHAWKPWPEATKHVPLFLPPPQLFYCVMPRATCKLIVRSACICFCCLTGWSQACCVSGSCVAHPAAGGCEALPCAGSRGSWWVIPVGAAGWEGAGWGLRAWGCPRLGAAPSFVLPAPRWVREAHAPVLRVPSALQTGCSWLCG